MKFEQCVSNFQYSWEHVVSHFWTKYPNPTSEHVIAEDTVERRLDDGRLISKRVLVKLVSLPPFALRIAPDAKLTYCVEESEVDREKKILTTYTRNINLLKYMSSHEKAVYSANPDQADSTVCEKQAWVSSPCRWGLGRAITFGGMRSWIKKAAQAQKGFELILAQERLPKETVGQSKAIPELLKDAAQRAKMARQKSAAVL